MSPEKMIISSEAVYKENGAKNSVSFGSCGNSGHYTPP
jgi:hypothetical protein